MRTHPDIIRDAGGAAGLTEKIGVNLNTARSWVQRGRIPVEAFSALANANIAAMDELLATRRPRGEPKISNPAQPSSDKAAA